MGIRLLMFVCAYLCVCIIMFDAAFVVHQAAEKYLMEWRKKQIVDMLSAQLASLEQRGKVSWLVQLKMRRRLAKADWLNCFVPAVDSFAKQHPEFASMLFYQSVDMLTSMAKKSKRRPPEYQAELAHIIYSLNKNKTGAYRSQKQLEKLHELAESIIMGVTDKYALLRANTFGAIVSIGNIRAIRHALKIINYGDKEINVKLLSSELLELEGGYGDILDAIYTDFSQYCCALKTCLIDFMSLIDYEEGVKKYVPEIISVLDDNAQNDEMRLAALRFFHKYSCAEAYPKIMKILNTRSADGTFAAEAAITLRAYPCEETVAALIEQLSDRDWYVRFNCADSLLELKVDYEQIIEKSDDKFAREMLIYRSEVMLLKQKRGKEFG